MNVETRVGRGNGTEPITLPQAESEISQAVPPDESADQRYGRQLGTMFSDALKRGEVSEFVGAMTWALANIASNYGMAGAGDILSRLGKGLCIIAEGERAASEAEEARRQGQKPH